jgi:ADP-ribosylglycohydrolase
MKYIESHFEEYTQKVYAGVLGKIIGVYMGRPFEGWTHAKIMERLGEVWYYANDKCGVPLIVTDDDITGTFTFLRALEDYPDSGKNLRAEQIGESWLNYVIESRTIFWWGGMGISTEHTAYQRLLDGYKAPQSGSAELNGKVVAEQIGAQIFIDGWALVAPDDPELAVKLAKEAGSVSHDGEAIYGAKVIAAMESLAFVEKDINTLIEKALTYIPTDSQVAEIALDMVRLYKTEPDWKKAIAYLYENYPYSKYGGFCPMVSNHGLIILSLLYGEDDFQRSQMIVNTGGWDTDCNAANVGCIMGIKNGLEGITKTADFREPVADRLYLPTAEGGRGISDALEVAQWIVNLGARIYGIESFSPKNGAKFNFEAPGAVQGFTAEISPDHLGNIRIRNREGVSRAGKHTLTVDFEHLSPGQKIEVNTLTGIPDEHYKSTKTAYDLIASSTLISGQMVKASVYLESSKKTSVMIALMVKVVHADTLDSKTKFPSPSKFISKPLYSNPVELKTETWIDLEFTVPETKGAPVSYVGLQVLHPSDSIIAEKLDNSIEAINGTLHVDYIDWSGVPDIFLWKSEWTNYAIDKSWCSSADEAYQLPFGDKPIILLKTKGHGFFTQGNRSWQDYRIEADITPRLFQSGGLVAYYQGQNRYLALVLCDDGKLKLQERIGSNFRTIAESDFTYILDRQYSLSIEIDGNIIKGGINGSSVLQGNFTRERLNGGSCGLLVEKGSLELRSFHIS